MTQQIIDTDVLDTAAAHLELRAANGTTDRLTVIWSTRARRCDPCDTIGEHATMRLAPDRVPAVWDPTGCGDWQISAQVQCGADGQLVTPRAVLRPGHMTGAALRSVAEMVAGWAAEDDEDDRQAVLDWLNATLEATVEEIAAGWRDRTELRPADQTGPGEVGVEDGLLTAWAYDPTGGESDIIVVTEQTSEAAGR